MHEGTIAQNIVEIVEKEVISRQLKGNVEKVVFNAGKMNAVIPESLCFYFDILKKERVCLQNAKLEVQEIPLMVSCDKCEKSFELEEPLFICQQCKGPLSVQSGKEMFVESFSVEDNP